MWLILHLMWRGLSIGVLFMSDFRMERNINQHTEVLSVVMMLLQAVAVKELSQKAKLLINRVCSTGRGPPSQVQNVLNELHTLYPLWSFDPSEGAEE